MKSKTKYEETQARVIANDGARAILEFPDGDTMTVKRADPLYKNQFAEDFVRTLPKGQRIPARTIGDKVWLPTPETVAKK